MKRSIRSYQRDIRQLQQYNKRLWRELASIVPPSVPYTLERDMKAGETIQIKFPKKFVTW